MSAPKTAERYRHDPQFRELHKQRTRLTYWRKRKIVRRPPATIFLTEYYANVLIMNPDDVRCGTEVRVPVYRIGQFAALLGRGPQTVRNLIKSKRIPAPVFDIDEGQRFGRGYTYDQMRVTWEYLPVLNFPDSRDTPPPKPSPDAFDKGRHDPDFKRAHREWKEAMLVHRYDHNPFSRTLKEAWSMMPDGLIVCAR